MNTLPTNDNEAPLLGLPPGVSVLAPAKPLIEMTDAELSAWHARLRDHSNHMTMQAHLAEVSVKPARTTKAKPSINTEEFV